VLVDGGDVVTGTVGATRVVVVAACVVDVGTVVVAVVVSLVVVVDGVTVDSVVTGTSVVEVDDVTTPLVAGPAESLREQADRADVRPITIASQRCLRGDITGSTRHSCRRRQPVIRGAGCGCQPRLRAERSDGRPVRRSHL
jgi:hypothetical protein